MNYLILKKHIKHEIRKSFYMGFLIGFSAANILWAMLHLIGWQL